jgi:hypothetical protein
VTKHEVTAHKTKLWLLALIASGAALTAGALVTAIDLQQPTSTEVTSSEMTMGVTSTQQTPPTTPETTFAEPAVKAKPFGG